MGARNPERELMKQKVDCETHVKLAESDLKSVKTTAKKLLNMVTELKAAYFQLVEGFQPTGQMLLRGSVKQKMPLMGKMSMEPTTKPTMIPGLMNKWPSTLKLPILLRIQLMS